MPWLSACFSHLSDGGRGGGGEAGREINDCVNQSLFNDIELENS